MNHASRLGLVLSLAMSLAPALARADRLVLYPVGGRADDSRIDEVEDSLARILRDQGHTLVPPTTAARPTAHTAMDAAANAAQALYVVVADVEPLPGQYRLHLMVYYRPAGRLEDLLVDVLIAQEQERLRDVLASMVRPEGLGEDAVRLTGIEETPEQRAARLAEEQRQHDAQAQADHDAQERARLAEEERQRQEAAAAAQREREQAEREQHEREERERNAWSNRTRYGGDGPVLLQLGVGGGYIGALTTTCGPTAPASCQSGGGLFTISAQVGHRIDAVEGLELRGGLDFSTGAVMGLALHGGAAWLGSFFTDPIYLGAVVDVGAFFALTGARNAAFEVRFAPALSWRPVAHLYIEIDAPELGFLLSGSSAVTVGGTVRVGYRF